jgi:hypothetical protein
MNWLTSTINVFFFFPIFWSMRGDVQHKIDLAFSDEFFFWRTVQNKLSKHQQSDNISSKKFIKSSHFLSEGFVEISRICGKIFQFCFFWFVILQTLGGWGCWIFVVHVKFSMSSWHVPQVPNVFLNMFPIALTLSHILCPKFYSCNVPI